MGTPDFAVPVLSRLMEAGHEIAAVYSQPDRPAGRGRKLVPTPTKLFAEERGFEARQPSSLRSEAECARLESLSPEVVVVAAYGLFLPPEALEIPPLGCLNIHPSLLPRYRGPSPVVSSILTGDDETGVTIKKLDEGMDSGPLLAQAKVQLDSRGNWDGTNPAAVRHRGRPTRRYPSRMGVRRHTSSTTGGKPCYVHDPRQEGGRRDRLD